MSQAVSKLTSSQEDYLEAILSLIRREQVARVRDIAKRLNVGKSAVTAALKTLSKRDLVNYDPYQFITLTAQGRQAAERVEDRHLTLQRFFQCVLGIDTDAAEANACRVEHSVDDEVVAGISDLADFMAVEDAAGESALAAFNHWARQRPTGDRTDD